MTADSPHGLAKAEELSRDRTRRVLELQSEGKLVMGYICLYPVVEMMTAAGVIPYRMFGDMREPVTEADAHLATVVCPFMRSCLDTGLKGRYDFLDGVVFAHVCDVSCMIPGIWRQTISTPYTHFIDIPHTTHDAAIDQFRSVLEDFRKTLQDYAGTALTDERIRDAVNLHNRQRGLMRELYEMRKQDPPLISGSETLKVAKAISSLPVEEGNALVEEVIREVQERSDGPVRKPARLLVWGSIIDDTAFIDMLESLEANVVMDDTCVGSRAYITDVPVTDDPLEGLARYYLTEIRCPRTVQEKDFRSLTKDYREDIAFRFGYLRDYARDWNANGVILQSVRYCDGHGYEVPAVKDYLASEGLPSIYLEHDYTESALAPLRTRVQGFTEIIE